MLCLEPSKGNVKTAQHGRYIEVKTPAVEMNCDLPIACAVQGHGCHVHFKRLPIECDLSPYDIMRDAFIGIDTMISEQTRRILYQYDERRWQVRLGRTKVNLYEDEVRDVCACLDIIGQRYAEALREATCLLETWEFAPGAARGKSGVQLLFVHHRTWHLMQRFAQEFRSSAGDTVWHCFKDLRPGESITIGKTDEPAQATIWAMPAQSYDNGDYIPLLYEYPDKELLAHEERTAQPWQLLSLTGVWTAAQAEQWLASIFIPQVFSYYQVYRDGSLMTPKGLRHKIAHALAPDVFALYRERFDVHPTTFAGDVEVRTPIEAIIHPADFIPYVRDLRQWFATYPVARMPAPGLRPYYAVTAEIVQDANPALASLCALTDMFAEMGKTGEIKPGPNGWRRLTSSFEGLLSTLTDQVRRINSIDYEDTTCAELLSLALAHILECKQQQISNEHLRKLSEAIGPLWEKARFDERYVLPFAV